MNRHILGLTGPAGCGKSTIASVFQYCAWDRFAFADPLKRTLMGFFITNGHTQDNALALVTTQEGKLSRPPCLMGRTVREALQSLGTQWGRQCIAHNLWVKLMVQRIQATICDVVVDDVRFDDEAQALRDLGGKIVLLHRQGEGLTGPSAQHESERGIAPHLIDARITNADTPAQVAKTILDLFLEATP
jgi:hypothetical protein